MSRETKGNLRGHVHPEEVLNYIKEHVDANAYITNMRTTPLAKKSSLDFVKERYDDSDEWIITCGFINFKATSGNHRCLFYYYSNMNTYENLKYFSELGLEEMVKSEKTYISMLHDEESVQIVSGIVSAFGGWFDACDCDDKEYVLIEKGIERKGNA